MADCPLGKTPDGDAKRDAIHVPIIPVVAGEKLYPGDGISFGRDGKARRSAEPEGIIDPFLSHPVHVDQRCYVLMNPGSVTKLRHEWDHPAIPPQIKEATDEFDDEEDPNCSGCY